MEDKTYTMWEKYNACRDRKTRNEIIMYYKPTLESIVCKMAHKYKDYYDFDDILGYGMIGLIDAIEKFDHKKGIKFQTYASIRIRGAIIDEVRRQDWIPRNIRQSHSDITNAEEEMTMELGRTPTAQELSDRLDMPLSKIAKIKRQWNAHTVLSLEEKEAAGDTYLKNHDVDIMPEESAMQKEEIKVLAETIGQLPERERMVVTLSFYEELTLKEIGKVLDITESRVSQIRSRAIAKLRKNMGAYAGMRVRA